ncbi:MAG: glycine/betaine ABC transporter [Candidatus Rokuibacteriota bacterium]|nr:MAG: glycine/betaine ABC transporter [Candidatus Rokubacteria bacterium]
MRLVILAWQHVAADPGQFRDAVLVHLELSALALLIAFVLALPAGIWVSRWPTAALVTLGAANTLRTIPSLAVLAFTLPFLGIGFLPSLVALTILGLPPILTNTYVGLRQVDADAVESAAGMGMTRSQILWRVELPLAMPVILAGVRTSAVQVVASATLAAFIGGGGLGDFITTGIGMMQIELLLVGAIPVTLLAIATELLFGSLERALTPRGLREVA